VRGDAHGHGLGLAIAKAAADVHRGTLTWEARPGGGSVFRLALPHAATGQEETGASRQRISGAAADQTATFEPGQHEWTAPSPMAPASRLRA
jgi:hypothetical protein